MRVRNNCLTVLTSLLILLTMTALVHSTDLSPREARIVDTTGISLNNPTLSSPGAVYTGMLKIHAVEPLSRWKDGSYHNYDFGFLDYIFMAELNIADGEIVEFTETWEGTPAGFGDITEDNIMATSVVFNSEVNMKDSYPNNNYWFFPNYSDATAAARPGVPGANYKGTGFTHTVFIEEATATW